MINNLQSRPTLLLSLCLLSLAGCGGGGGSDKPANSSSPNNTAQSSAQSSSQANDPDFDAITGLYDASITSNNIKDESYLYISGAGKITAYNYLGDAKDAGNNCYRVAIDKDINAGINDKTISYSKEKAEYTTSVNGNSIVWQLDANKTITKIVYGGSISSSRISLTSGGVSLVIDSKKITSPSITDITSSLCK